MPLSIVIKSSIQFEPLRTWGDMILGRIGIQLGRCTFEVWMGYGQKSPSRSWCLGAGACVWEVVAARAGSLQNG